MKLYAYCIAGEEDPLAIKTAQSNEQFKSAREARLRDEKKKAIQDKKFAMLTDHIERSV
jgi:hypothetical protein